ncbi:MAG: DNA-3-methyladenine glycosylase I, partial [Devosia sp.]
MTDAIVRCDWAGADPLYQHYHDKEWGRPVIDDNRLFEKISLEGFQSGLSWFTILKKRERFREVFFGFDPKRVAMMGDA